MKRFLTVCILTIYWVIAYGQNPVVTTKKIITTKKVAVTNDGTMGLDTTILAIDEKGNKLHFYQYIKLLQSGQYDDIIPIDRNGQLLTEYRLKKRDPIRDLEIYEMAKKQIASKSAVLQEGSKLTIAPLAHLIKPEEFEGKAIVLVFFTAECDQCNRGLAGMDSFFKEVYDPEKMIIVAINYRDKDKTYEQLKLTPLPNARIIYDAYKIIKEAYWINASNAFVVTDKNHVIQFTAEGSGGIINTVFRSKVKAVLN
ncbi:hypothetical protein GCM10027049_19260 [Mucilaginibacter puniceus]